MVILPSVCLSSSQLMDIQKKKNKGRQAEKKGGGKRKAGTHTHSGGEMNTVSMLMLSDVVKCR